MIEKAIISQHGFNSAPLDVAGNLLIHKDKLLYLHAYFQSSHAQRGSSGLTLQQ